MDEAPAGAQHLQRLLSETKGVKVQLYVPQRGDTKKLVDMARTNAFERLARESGRYAREQRALDETAHLLGLAAPPQDENSNDL